MVYLLPNTANQSLYLSLYEGRYTLADFTHYMLSIIREENSETGVKLNQVPTVITDGSGYSHITVTTSTLTQAGRYRYVVYGQNSSTNIDDEDASIVGIVEIGYLELTDNGTYYDVVETTTANDIIID
jgi:hypothetical protein